LKAVTGWTGRGLRAGLLVALVLLLLTSLLLVLPVKASDTTIWVDPQLNYVGVGDNFTVEVRLGDVQNLFTWVVALSFNASVLNVLNVTLAPDHIFNGHEIVTPDPLIDNVEGYVLHGATLMGSDETSGSGGLDQITFAVVGHGQSTLKIDREGDGSISEGYGSFLLDVNINNIAFTAVDGYHHNHLVGDVTGLGGKPDARVNMVDVAYLVIRFDTKPGSPKWDPTADLNGDGIVNMKDVNVVMSNFGHRWP